MHCGQLYRPTCTVLFLVAVFFQFGWMDVSPTCHNNSRVTCTCPDGYIYFGNSCQDVDECSTRNGRCQQRCINTPGGYRCHCEEGYQLAKDNHRCDDFDECEQNNGNCTDGLICVNTWEGRYCLPSSILATRSSEALEFTMKDSFLNNKVVIGLTLWLSVLSGVLIIIIGVLVRQTPSRREKSLTRQAHYLDSNSHHFLAEMWPKVLVRSQAPNGMQTQEVLY